MASSDRNKNNLPPVRLYRQLEWGEQIVVFADPAESQDFCAATAFSKKHFDYPLVYNQRTESSQFGYDLEHFCRYVYNRTQMWPVLAVERNVGQATLYVLQQLNYPRIFRMVDTMAANGNKQGSLGWLTTGSITAGEIQGTRRKMLDDFALTLRQGQITMYDEQQLLQFKSFVISKTGKAQARANTKDDLVMATCGAWQIHLLTPTEYLDDFDVEEFRKQQDKWRFR